MTTQPTPAGRGVHTVHLERTIDAVRQALPEAEAREFIAIIESVNVAELPHTFEYWWRRAVIAQVPGLAERIAAGRLASGRGVPAEDVIPGFAELVAARREAA